MHLTEIWNLFLLVAVLTPFIAILSVYSFKYHVALYEATSQEVHTFVKGLFYPLKIFYSLNNYGMYYDRPKYSAEQIASSLYTRRLFVSIMPLLFIGVSIIVIIRMIPSGDVLIIRYILLLVFLPYFLRAAWRFGINIKQTKSYL
jgi:hypothetical protein